MRFFFDNCISPKLARAIHVLTEPEHAVVHLREKWPGADTRSVPDTEWLETLGRERDWVIVTGDTRIKTRPGERGIWRAARLTTFFMAEGFTNQDEWEQVRWLIDKWPQIVEQAGKVVPGSAFRVPKPGKWLETA